MKGDVAETLATGSLAQIRRAYLERQVSVREAIEFFVRRVEASNPGPRGLNAIRALAPDLAAQAQRADADIAAKRGLGPLHGIPVLLKDNISTADGMTTTAGAAALAQFVPTRDAGLVARLREAGAIIFGKANMTEFADYVSDVMPSGFSSAGGVVRNPHGLEEYGRGQGSSVGSAAAVAAGLVPVAIGSETQNSIQTPACVTSVFGYKPSVGCVSRAGIVPLVSSQDSPGPLARSAEDVALVLSVIAGADPRDTATIEAALDAARESGTRDLRSVRIGVPRRTIADRADLADVMPLFEDALRKLAAAGAPIVDPSDLPSAEQLQDVRSSVFRTEFKSGLNAFLADNGRPCGMGCLADIIRWNEDHSEHIPYGQSLLLAAQATKGYDDPQYRADRLRDIALSRTAGIDAALQLGAADVLIAPMGSAAKVTGKAGAPAFAIPVGLNPAGQPFGVTLFTSKGADQQLIAIGKAVADAIAIRTVPSI
jgi:amidase